MNKRIIAVLLALLMLAFTAGCGEDEKRSFLNQNAVSEIDFGEEPVTITYLTIGDKPTNGRTEEVVAQLNDILLKRLNAQLDIYYIGWDDYLENYNKTLQAGEVSLDLIGVSADWLDGWQNVMKGNFLPLSEDMLRKYCAVTYTNISMAQWRDCTYNGSIYFIPENEYTQWTNHGFIYRKDLAAEAGVPEIRSWKDMDIYFRSVVKKHPDMIAWDTDGKEGTPVLGYFMSAKKYVPIYELTGYGLWGEDADNPGKIVSPFYTGDELVEYAKLMKSWDRTGVWRSDVSLSGNNEKEFYNGQSAAIQQHTQKYFMEIKPQMQITMPDAELGFFWFGRESGNLLRQSILHGAMAVSSTSENPERALMVYDMLRNDQECYRLIRYGIEGVQYTLTPGGMMERPSGYNEDKDGIVTNFWWGRRDELEIADSSYAWDDYYDLVDSYEHVAVDYPWEGMAFATPELNAEIQNFNAICDKYIPLISTGQYEGEPEDIVAEFRNELMKAGFERITGQIQRNYNAQ